MAYYDSDEESVGSMLPDACSARIVLTDEDKTRLTAASTVSALVGVLRSILKEVPSPDYSDKTWVGPAGDAAPSGAGSQVLTGATGALALAEDALSAFLYLRSSISSEDWSCLYGHFKRVLACGETPDDWLAVCAHMLPAILTSLAPDEMGKSRSLAKVFTWTRIVGQDEALWSLVAIIPDTCARLLTVFMNLTGLLSNEGEQLWKKHYSPPFMRKAGQELVNQVAGHANRRKYGSLMDLFLVVNRFESDATPAMLSAGLSKKQLGLASGEWALRAPHSLGKIWAILDMPLSSMVARDVYQGMLDQGISVLEGELSDVSGALALSDRSGRVTQVARVVGSLLFKRVPELSKNKTCRCQSAGCLCCGRRSEEDHALYFARSVKAYAIHRRGGCCSAVSVWRVRHPFSFSAVAAIGVGGIFLVIVNILAGLKVITDQLINHMPVIPLVALALLVTLVCSMVDCCRQHHATKHLSSAALLRLGDVETGQEMGMNVAVVDAIASPGPVSAENLAIITAVSGVSRVRSGSDALLVGGHLGRGSDASGSHHDDEDTSLLGMGVRDRSQSASDMLVSAH